MVQSLMLLKNNTTNENQLSIMNSRAKNLATKYNQLVTQLRVHGVDFILATGKSSQTKALESRLRKNAANNQAKRTNASDAKMSGFFSSLDRGATTT